jgi:hypothetical protein
MTAARILTRLSGSYSRSNTTFLCGLIRIVRQVVGTTAELFVSMQMTLQVSETIIRVESLRKYQHFPVGYESRERGLFRSR